MDNSDNNLQSMKKQIQEINDKFQTYIDFSFNSTEEFKNYLQEQLVSSNQLTLTLDDNLNQELIRQKRIEDKFVGLYKDQLDGNQDNQIDEDFFNKTKVKFQDKVNEINNILDINDKLALMLSKKIKGMQEKHDNVDKKEEEKIDNNDSGYQLTLDFDSIDTLKGGIVIEKMDKKFMVIKKKTVLSGILGLYNKGKSFLIKKLSGRNIPIGFHKSTKGLNLAVDVQYDNEEYFRQSQKIIIYVDTKGMGEPIQVFNKSNQDLQKLESEYDQKIEQAHKTGQMSEVDDLKQKKEKLKQEIIIEAQSTRERKQLNNRATEHFLQNFIMNECNVIIVAVGSLTGDEEKILHFLKKQTAVKYEQKKLIIVHNFVKLSKFSDVLTRINQDIKNTFDVIRRNENYQGQFIDYFVDESYDKMNPIFHFIMAEENSEAGNIFNDFTVYKIKQLIYQEERAQPINFIKKFTDYVQNNLSSYINYSDKQVDFQWKITEEKKDNQLYQIITSEHLKNIEQFEIRRFQTDAFGQLNDYFSNEFKPKYDVIEQQDKYIVMIEISGLSVDCQKKIKFTIKSQENKRGLLLTRGEKTNFRSVQAKQDEYIDSKFKEKDYINDGEIRHGKINKFFISLCPIENELIIDQESKQYVDGFFIINIKKVDVDNDIE